MKRVLFTAKVVKLHINVFHLPLLRLFKDAGWETAVAAKNDYDPKEACVIPSCDHFYDIDFDRNVFSIKSFRLYRQLKDVIKTGDYDIIHTHTPIVSAFTRVAARKTGARVIYTAHGFHFFKGAPLRNWLLYYPVEKLCSRWTDLLITINQEDYELAERKFHAQKVEMVPGVGIDRKRFLNTVVDRLEKRKEIGVPKDAFVLFSAGELVKNKNHETVIKALAALEDPSIHYVIAGEGELKQDLQKLAGSLGIGANVHLIGYRKDMAELYKTVDLVIHPSLREGLPVVVMEAMASGTNTIASSVRGNRDLLPKDHLFDCKDVEGIMKKVRDCRQGLIAPVMLSEEYSIEKVQERMRELYGI